MIRLPSMALYAPPFLSLSALRAVFSRSGASGSSVAGSALAVQQLKTSQPRPFRQASACRGKPGAGSRTAPPALRCWRAWAQPALRARSASALRPSPESALCPYGHFPRRGWPRPRPARRVAAEVGARQTGEIYRQVSGLPGGVRAGVAGRGSPSNGVGALECGLASTPSSSVERRGPGTLIPSRGVRAGRRCRAATVSHIHGRAAAAGPQRGEHLLAVATPQQQHAEGIGVQRVGDQVADRGGVLARVGPVRAAAAGLDLAGAREQVEPDAGCVGGDGGGSSPSSSAAVWPSRRRSLEDPVPLGVVERSTRTGPGRVRPCDPGPGRCLARREGQLPTAPVRA